MVTVYVLRGGKTRKRYVGITNNLPRRIREHRVDGTVVAITVGLDFEVILTELYPDYVSARQRERFLKSGAGREWLNSRLEGSRPASGG